MRVAFIALILAVAFAANATNETTMSGGGQQEQQKQFKGGCNLRCRQLRFIGEASVPVKPKWALLDLSVEVNSLQLQGGASGSSNISGGSSGGGNQSAMAKKVGEEAKHRSAFVLNYLKDLKMEEIKDLQTQEMSFVPMYDDDRNLIGYKATFGLSFKVVLDKLQEVLDHIVSESGANRLNSIVFVADEDDEKQANIKAIELATQNAWDQAQAITKVFGIQGNLKLLSVREKIQPLKRIIRRIAARRLMDSDMGGMDDDDNNEGGDFSMLKLLKGDTIVNARLVFNFDFEDGTISFQQVQPIESNFTVADTFGGLLKGGANETNKQPQQPGETQAVQPANNATAPNTTAAAQPGVTQPVQPGVTQPPAQPQPQPT